MKLVKSEDEAYGKSDFMDQNSKIFFFNGATPKNRNTALSIHRNHSIRCHSSLLIIIIIIISKDTVSFLVAPNYPPNQG